MNDAARLLLEGPTFLTNGGTETYLLFRQGFLLRDGCGFEVFDDDDAWRDLARAYLHPILDAACHHGHGLLLDLLVWRAHPDYVSALGYPADDVERFNRKAFERTAEAVSTWREESRDGRSCPILLSADLGPRGDGYTVGDARMRPSDAYAYHRRQIEVLAETGVDVLSAITMTSVDETIGLVRAAAETGIPVVVSPTVEVDGRVPDGTPLGEFVHRVDDETDATPLFYMVNCAHPSHVVPTLRDGVHRGENWLGRFRGFRANASRKSHDELDECPELDRGDPDALAREVAEMKRTFDLRVVGGCCGTDAEHIAAIAASV